MKSQFSNKAVIVTGGASGIGRTTAKRFAAEGAGVCVADRDLTGAQKVVAEIHAAGGLAFSCEVDVANPDDNEQMVSETIARFGGIDYAFLNAAYLGHLSKFFDSDIDDFDRVIAVNLRGVYLGLKSVGKKIRTGGSVVVASSSAGTTGWPSNASYSASKHGVIGLMRSAAAAYAAKGARVNAICPGLVNTAMTPDAIRGDVADEIISPDALIAPPFRGLGSTQHIAEVVLFLVSSRSAFITGSVQMIDGGLLSSFTE